MKLVFKKLQKLIRLKSFTMTASIEEIAKTDRRSMDFIDLGFKS